MFLLDENGTHCFVIDILFLCSKNLLWLSDILLLGTIEQNLIPDIGKHWLDDMFLIGRIYYYSAINILT